MRIAVGLDLNLDGYDWLLRRAVAFTAALHGHLDLVHIGAGERRLATLDHLLHQVEPSVRGAARLVPGDPMTELVALTQEYDGLVVGPREPTGIERLYQNPMAVRVLRRSHCPVYVPRTDRFGTRPPKILLGLALQSKLRPWVLNRASRLALAIGGSIDLVYTMPRSLPAVASHLREAAEKEWQALNAPELTALREQLLLLPEAVRGNAQLMHGEAEDVLCSLSEHYDLLLVGNRDRRGLERLLLGGVARQVVTRAQCDVVVLPTAYAIEEPLDEHP